MVKNILLITVLAFVFSAFVIPEKIAKKADKAIAKFYEIENFSKTPLTISDILNSKTPSDFSKENLFKIEAKGSFLGYGYVGNAPSKTATFDYIVLFDKDFIITKSKVLVYREEYGGEIGSNRWLRQFEGSKAGTKELKYQEDIIPISGATISVRSMTKAVNELLESIATLQAKKAL